ncbi:hypothetical protein [Nocardia panacis]|uniref:hypothetical protein n=1 Tax=Nocardia panacis TaxID=2340916 RepID=UPI00193989F9|nr:hypothetical protein [Nocardia panacis]
MASPADTGDSGADPVRRLADLLARHGPAGWRQVDAVFAMTVATEVGKLVYSIGDHTVALEPPESVRTLVRTLRAAAARSPEGPWLRLLVTADNAGAIEIDYDYGELPMPPGQLFPPEVYRADLRTYPRERVPVWLAAYVGHGDRQRRPPRAAAGQARTDLAAGVWATLVENELPPFPKLWARWVTLAAVFVAAGSEWGPRILPWSGVFEGATHGGSTLYVLPGGRAVLSGGVWNDPALAAAYLESAPLPNLYAGAPDWVADPVLDPRAASGLLSFCYWWDSGHWYRAEIGSDCAEAVPGVWTATTTLDIIATVAPDLPREHAVALLTAAESARVTRAGLEHIFDADHDIDGALYQFTLAGLVSAVPQPMPENRALAMVRDYLAGHGLPETPVAQMIAERFGIGWIVRVPAEVEPAIYYIVDDGRLERTAPTVTPATAIAELERQFRRRHRIEG